MSYLKLIIILLFLVTKLSVLADLAFSSDDSFRDEPIQPIPLGNSINTITDTIVDPQKVALGDKLFHDPLLSSDNTISCASCHDVNRFGIDHLPTSIGIKEQVGTVNAPTVMNSGYNISQFWDGRAEHLQEQAEGPVANPIEMGDNWNEIIIKLKKNVFYIEAFEKIYPDGISKHSVTDAIQEYEMTLLTRNAPFDQYLRGDSRAINEQQKRGYSLFKDYGCIACHQGVNVGGNMYQGMGSFLPYFTPQITKLKPEDLGRFNVTKLDKDKFFFKVPSLRLAAYTAPYFHDGSIKTIKEAINIMAKHQLGRDIPEHEIDDIIAFLKSLAGTYKAENQ